MKTIDISPEHTGVCRSFTNVSDEEGYLQVLITGGVYDRQDIAFPLCFLPGRVAPARCG